MTNTVNISIAADGIATLTFDVPGRSMNVLTPQLITELKDAVERIATDPTIKGAILTSGKQAFIAGADLTDLVQAFDTGRSAVDQLEFINELSGLFRRMETCGKPFVAAINGTALGGGLEVCLACHYRIAADTKAVLGLPEVQVGLLPGGGGTQRLPRLIGLEKSAPLILEGKHVPPAKALELGFIDEVVAPDALLGRAREWLLGEPEAVQPWDKKGFRMPGGIPTQSPKQAQNIMFGTALVAKNTQHNYPAPIAILSCLFEGSVVPIDTALGIEARYFASLLADPVARNMTRSLFINKGLADKLARRPAGPPARRVSKLGVLGAGMMGAGIAYVSAYAGMEVILLDMAQDGAERGKDYSRKLLAKRVARGKMDQGKADAILAQINPTTNYEDLAGCELVIEAVFEDRGIKAKVTQQTEAIIASDAVFASNTSTLPITGLAEASSRPGNFIGLHFFSPVDKMPLVEVILGKQTSDECLAWALDYVQQIRKTPIVVNDSRGFYTSRVFSTFTAEGMHLLSEGVKPALIENAAKQAGMPVGPLAVTDEVTIELAYKITKQTMADLGDSFERTAATDVIFKFIEDLNRKGKRYGAGFYDYPEDGEKHLWPELGKHFPAAAVQPDVETVKQRLLYVQALDAVRCLEENVLTHPVDADLGSILGWGFPPYTGGALSLIETVGLASFVAECDELAAQHGKRFEVPPGLRERAAQDRSYYHRDEAAYARNAA